MGAICLTRYMFLRSVQWDTFSWVIMFQYTKLQVPLQPLTVNLEGWSSVGGSTQFYTSSYCPVAIQNTVQG